MENTSEAHAPVDDSSEDVVTRETLYELAWSIQMSKIGEHYGVSSSNLARVFTSLNTPRPPVGYWAQVAVGKGKGFGLVISLRGVEIERLFKFPDLCQESLTARGAQYL